METVADDRRTESVKQVLNSV